MEFPRRHRLLFQALISTLFIVLLIWRIDIIDALRHLRDIDPRWAVLAFGIFVVSRLIQAYRWRVFLWRWPRLPLTHLLGIHLVSTLVNALVPLRAGDVLRVQIASQRLHIPRAELVATVFVMETLMDWVTAIVLLVAGFAFMLPIPIFSPPLIALLTVLVAAILAGAVALAHRTPAPDITTRPPLRWLPDRVRRAAGEAIPRFLDGLLTLRDPSIAVRAGVASLAIYGAEITLYWCLGRAFGLPLTFIDYFAVMVGANIVLALSLTPWSIGPFEIAVVEVSVLLGVDRAAAATYAMGAHLLLLIWVNLSGLIAVWALGLSLRDLRGGKPAQAVLSGSGLPE